MDRVCKCDGPHRATCAVLDDKPAAPAPEVGTFARRHIEQTIAQMRRDDREFITPETVAQFDGCSEAAAAVVIEAVLGHTREQMAVGAGEPERHDIVADDGREFGILRGVRWTRIAEFLSNGQLTARWFVDEATGEVRMAEGWRKPKSYPLDSRSAEFVRGLLALRPAREGVM